MSPTPFGEINRCPAGRWREGRRHTKLEAQRRREENGGDAVSLPEREAGR